MSADEVTGRCDGRGSTRAALCFQIQRACLTHSGHRPSVDLRASQVLLPQVWDSCCSYIGTDHRMMVQTAVSEAKQIPEVSISDLRIPFQKPASSQASEIRGRKGQGVGMFL